MEEINKKLKQLQSNGEWVYCGNGKNLPAGDGEYYIIIDGKTIFKKLNFNVRDKIWFSDDGDYCGVIAWWKEYPYES